MKEDEAKEEANEEPKEELKEEPSAEPKEEAEQLQYVLYSFSCRAHGQKRRRATAVIMTTETDRFLVAERNPTRPHHLSSRLLGRRR